MIAYQQSYRPSYTRATLSQGPSSAAIVPPPGPDPLFTGYFGVPGFIEAIAVLTISGAAAWVGIRTGMGEEKNDYLKVAGWVGGVGSILIGLLYLGAKSGVSQAIGLPAVRVSPS
jgi:hypothetical protein